MFMEFGKNGLLKLRFQKVNFIMEYMGGKEKGFVNEVYFYEFGG